MYELLSKFAQTGGLLMFVLAFGLVVYYALAPRNRQTFDDAARMPLEDEEMQNDDE